MKSTTLIAHLVALATLLTVSGARSEQRQAFADGSPPWLQSVGKLDVPGIEFRDGKRRHQRENCSGTRVAPAGQRLADTVVTAWHCLEFYNDLSKSITFTLLPGSDQAIRREAYRLADGGGMHADWALLRLHRPVDTRLVPAMELNPQRGDLQRPVTMAGFSGDEGLGRAGAVLTYHQSCQIIRQERGASETDCSAYRGASGGAVIQLSQDGGPRLTGVISRGNSDGLSIYIPVSGFRGPLEQHVN